jgi:hypothetical protein
LLFTVFPPLLVVEPKDLGENPQEANQKPERASIKEMLMSIQPLWGFLVYGLVTIFLISAVALALSAVAWLLVSDDDSHNQ